MSLYKDYVFVSFFFSNSLNVLIIIFARVHAMRYLRALQDLEKLCWELRKTGRPDSWKRASETILSLPLALCGDVALMTDVEYFKLHGTTLKTSNLYHALRIFQRGKRVLLAGSLLLGILPNECYMFCEI